MYGEWSVTGSRTRTPFAVAVQSAAATTEDIGRHLGPLEARRLAGDDRGRHGLLLRSPGRATPLQS